MPKLGNHLDANGFKVTGLATPTASGDAVTKSYADALKAGLRFKDSVKAASTANLTLSGTQTVDGVALVADDRVLVKNQSTASQNGIYVVASGSWSRAADADSWAELVSAFVFVEQGTTLGDTSWNCPVDQGGTLGSTSVTWTQFGSAAAYNEGTGIQLSGNQFSVRYDDTTIGITSNALTVKTGGIGAGHLATGAVDLATTVVTGTLTVAKGGTGQTTAKAARETGLGAAGVYSATGPASSSTTISVPQSTHGLRASMNLVVSCKEAATGNEIIPTVAVTSGGDVTITFGAAQSTNAIAYTIQG